MSEPSASLTVGQQMHATILRPQPPAVYVDGKRRRELKVARWEITGPPTFGRVVLVLHRSGQPTRAVRMERVDELPPIGAAVRVRPRGLGEAAEFQGVVTAHRLELGEDGEHLAAEAEHALGAALAAAITDRWHLVDGEPQALAHARVRFNRDDLASDDTVVIGGRRARVFDAAATARRWTVADALAYVLATAVPKGVAAPSLSQLQSMARRTDAGTVEITGLSAAEALARLAARAGLAIRAARTGLGLEVYRPGRTGRTANVSLQPAGQELDLARSNLWRGQVVIGRRPSRRGVLALGAAKRYESTFVLSPGWDLSLHTSRWRDTTRAHSPNWPALRDVYRKWVLNEHGWYCPAPWLLPVGSFAALGSEDFPLRRPRPLGPCLSRNRNGSLLGVVVEFRCAADGPWRPWPGPVWVSQEECAVYLGGDVLSGEYFQAAVAGAATVRATGTVEADARLTVEMAGDPHLATAVVDASDLMGWQKVHATSVFFGRDDLGPPAERDDSEALRDLAEQHAEIASTALTGTLTLGWVDLTCGVGDTVDQVKHRSIELRPSPDRLAFVRGVRHDFGEAQTTTLALEG